MLCQKCHKNLATVRYAEVVDGKVTDLHLCADCLAKHQENPGAGFELSGPVSTAPRAAASGSRAETRKYAARRACKACGKQLAKVLETAALGCNLCYRTFAEELEPLLADLHGNTHHVGKRPRFDDARSRLTGNLQTKRALLRSAVQTEHYEEAALLRDEIRQLEEALGAAQAGHTR